MGAPRRSPGDRAANRACGAPAGLQDLCGVAAPRSVGSTPAPLVDRVLDAHERGADVDVFPREEPRGRSCQNTTASCAPAVCSRGSAVPLALMDSFTVAERRYEWTPWIRLERSFLEPQLTTEPGLYRIRRAGDAGVDYIGQTGVGIRARVRMLRGIINAEMPYRDPHTAAPALWAMLQFPGMGGCPRPERRRTLEGGRQRRGHRDRRGLHRALALDAGVD